MTAQELNDLVDKANAEAESTTVLYPTWLKRVQTGYYGTKDPTTATAWGRFFGYQDRIRHALDTVTPPPPPPPPSGTVKPFGIDRLGGTLAAVSNLDRFGFVAGDSADGPRLATIAGEQIMYMAAADLATFFTGIDYQEAMSKGWTLGSEAAPYQANQLLNVGLDAVRQAAIVEIDAYLRARLGPPNGRRGIYLDDVVASLDVLMGGNYPQAYPDAAAWWPAMQGFVAVVGDGLRAKGWRVHVNAIAWFSGNVNVFPGTDSNNGSAEAEWCRKLAPHVDNILVEDWMRANGHLRSTANSWDNAWAGWRSVHQAIVAAGKGMFPTVNVSSADTSSLVYTLATFLLDWNGSGGVMQFGSGDPAASAEWLQEPGAPLEVATQVGVGWRRRHGQKTAYVNPHPSQQQDFGGGIVLAPVTASVV